MVHFKTGRVGHDPLNPQYRLTHVEERPITPPKFVKDSIYVNVNHLLLWKDIEGARPKKQAYYQTRDQNLNVKDIQGAMPLKKNVRSPGTYDNLDYSDITRPNFVSKRVVNPLNPTYNVQGETG